MNLIIRGGHVIGGTLTERRPGRLLRKNARGC